MTDIDDLAARVSALESAQVEILRAIGQLRASLGARFDQVDASLNPLPRPLSMVHGGELVRAFNDPDLRAAWLAHARRDAERPSGQRPCLDYLDEW